MLRGSFFQLIEELYTDVFFLRWGFGLESKANYRRVMRSLTSPVASNLSKGINSLSSYSLPRFLSIVFWLWGWLWILFLVKFELLFLDGCNYGLFLFEFWLLFYFILSIADGPRLWFFMPYFGGLCCFILLCRYFPMSSLLNGSWFCGI